MDYEAKAYSLAKEVGQLSLYLEQIPVLARALREAHAAGLEEVRSKPEPMVLYCPAGHQHVDEGEWATRHHRTHQCQAFENDCRNGHPGCDLHRHNVCGLEWRPANFPTVGVAALANPTDTEKAGHPDPDPDAARPQRYICDRLGPHLDGPCERCEKRP